MFLASLQKRLTNLLEEENIDLEETRVGVVFPTSLKNIFSKRKRKLIEIFEEIERRVRDRADPTYEDIERFREVGGYLLIREKESRDFLESVFETEGEIGRPVVFPGRGLDFRWSCALPDIKTLNIDWESAVFFIKYHSHPFTNHPHPQDITSGIRNLRDIPKNVEYLQTIYSKLWAPNFLWLKHY
ncbi:hypothetical protein ES703_22616 [subsurface metagenome]